MLRETLKDSKMMRNRSEQHLYHADNPDEVIVVDKVQEYYSLRCVSQVLGPIYDTIVNAEKVVVDELNSVNDNPIIDHINKNIFHGGNFHGDYVSLEMDKLKMKLKDDLRSRRRGTVIFIIFVFAALMYPTGGLLFHLVWPDPTLDKINFAREWGSLLVLALPWSAAILFAWQYRRHRAAHQDYERSIAASLRALLDENRLSRTRLKVAALVHGLFLAILPLVVYQLRATGKAGDEILVPAFVLWPLIAVGIGLALLYNYRRKLLPQQHELETLLRSYDQTEETTSGRL